MLDFGQFDFGQLGRNRIGRSRTDGVCSVSSVSAFLVFFSFFFSFFFFLLLLLFLSYSSFSFVLFLFLSPKTFAPTLSPKTPNPKPSGGPPSVGPPFQNFALFVHLQALRRLRGRRGLSHDSLRGPKHHQNSPRREKQRHEKILTERKNENGGRKKARNFLRPHLLDGV